MKQSAINGQSVSSIINLECSDVEALVKDNKIHSVGWRLKQNELALAWIAQLWFLFVLTFVSGRVLGLGGNDVHIGMQSNVMILFCIVAAFLFEAANLEARLCSTRTAISFHSVVWASALSWSLLQRYFSTVHISAASIKQWTTTVWLLAFCVTVATAMCALVHLTHAQAERAARQLILWFCVFCFLCTLWCSVPPQSTVHLHHWQIGFIAAIFFRRQDALQKEGEELSMLSREKRPRCFEMSCCRNSCCEPVSSFYAQAVALGIFVHGVAVFGFGAFFVGIPECIS